MAGVALLLAVCGGGAVAASTPVVVAEHGETVVNEHESAYQFIRIARWPGRDGQPDALNLSLDEGLLEFHSRKRDGPLTGAYYDAFAVLPEWIAESERDPVRVMVIGGGAGTMRGLLRSLQGGRIAQVIDVEIDPAVLAFSDRFGGVAVLPDQAITADGRVALEAIAGPFDLVILDAYARQLAIPPHLATREAFELVRSKLSPRGVFAINVSAADVDSELPRALTATLRTAFPKVWSIAIPGSWNFVLLAGNPVVPAVADSTGPLAPVRVSCLRGFHQITDDGGGAVLTDDCAPLESLGRRIR
jgi:spermidine synthase